VTMTAELARRCAERPRSPSALPPNPLPPLVQEPAMPREANVLLGVVHEGTVLTAQLSSPLPGRALAGASVPGTSAIDLTLGGDLCGPLAFRGRLTPDASNQNIVFDGLSVAKQDAQRAAQAGVDAAALSGELSGKVLFPVSVRPDDLRAALPVLASAASDDRFALSATVQGASLHSAGLRGTQMIAVERLNGSITVRQK